MNLKDLSGQCFGNWTVLRKDDQRSTSETSYYLCKCVCGTVRSVTRSSLVCGRSKSCGCIKTHKKGINQTHGMSKTRIYKEWLSMRRRCRNPNDKSAKNYVLKGISVCDEWESDFVAFRDWSYAHGYSDDLTIDRIDNGKGYSPENCRWVSADEQSRNRTNNVMVEYEGRQWCLRTLCNEIGFPYKLANRRYNRARKSGKYISTEELLAPVNENKIAKCYRKT